MSPTANTDGLLNCLCQPGLLLYRRQKFMRRNLSQLIKSCGTRTVPAAETKSIGLAADAQVSWFLLTHLDSFIVTRQPSSTYRDLVPFRQFILTHDFSSIYQDLQKPRHRDADGNSPNRRTVSCKANYRIYSFCRDFRRTRKSFAARPCNRPVAAKHMLFGLPGLSRLDKFSYIRKSSSFIGTLQSRQIKS